MAEFCRTCTVEVLGEEADRNDLATGKTIRALCEGCGFGTFDPSGQRVVSPPGTSS